MQILHKLIQLIHPIHQLREGVDREKGLFGEFFVIDSSVVLQELVQLVELRVPSRDLVLDLLRLDADPVDVVFGSVLKS